MNIKISRITAHATPRYAGGFLARALACGVLFVAGAMVEPAYPSQTGQLEASSSAGNSEPTPPLNNSHTSGACGDACLFRAELFGAKQGDVGAAENACADYVQGFGAHRDVAKATPFCVEAGEHGRPDAFGYLGWAYRNGNGVPQNYATAAKWFARAAELGSAIDQYALAEMYFLGEGVPQDYVQSAKWAIIAHAHQHKFDRPVLFSLADVEARMSQSQISEAQQLASKWWQAHQDHTK